MSIFISPHNDDETLFGAFTLLREKPLVVVVFDGHLQEARGLPVTWQQRRAETTMACKTLGCDVTFLGLSDADPRIDSGEVRWAIFNRIGPIERIGRIYAPAYEAAGHAHHNTVAEAMPSDSWATRYMTYTDAGKSTSDTPVPVLEPDWIRRKLLALACYESQFNLDPRMGCWPHFLRSQEEYYL